MRGLSGEGGLNRTGVRGGGIIKLANTSSSQLFFFKFINFNRFQQINWVNIHKQYFH